jgi:ABC-2 type transport system ATP-binding protein
MIEGGKMVFEDTMEAFNNYIVPDSFLVSMDAPPVIEQLQQIPGVNSAEALSDKTFRFTFTGSQSITKDIIDMSVRNNWGLREISLEKSSLDEVFARLSRSQNTQ